MGRCGEVRRFQTLFNIWSEKQLFGFFFVEKSQLKEMDFLFRSWLMDEPGFLLLPGRFRQ